MIICICGKSGSGKTTIAKSVQKAIPNSIHIDIDKIAHKSHTDKLVKQNLITAFGNDILTNQDIDRKKLRNIVFNDKYEMEKLENITWNYMENEIDKIIELNKDKVIILDYLLLPKTKYFSNCDFKILINIPYEIRKERVLSRDNISEEDFDLREKRTIHYDINKFDFILQDNNINELKKKVLKYE